MDLGISGKTAVVTGGARNLGYAVVEELLREGCNVFIVSKTQTSVDKALQSLSSFGNRVDGVAADLTVRQDVARAFQAVRDGFGAPDILIYNNGGPPNALFDAATDEEYIEGYKLVVMGFAWCVREVAPGMKEKKWGRIVTLGSIAAKEPHHIIPMPIHNLVRPAAHGLSKTLSNELGKFGITVNTVGTGRIATTDPQGSFRRTYREGAERLGITVDQLVAKVYESIPTGRPGRPDEVAGLTAFLCSERAAFINGQLVIIDGGQVTTL